MPSVIFFKQKLKNYQMYDNNLCFILVWHTASIINKYILLALDSNMSLEFGEVVFSIEHTFR